MRYIEFTPQEIERVLRTEISDPKIRFDFLLYLDRDGEEKPADWSDLVGPRYLELNLGRFICITQIEYLAMIDALAPYGIRISFNVDSTRSSLRFHK